MMGDAIPKTLNAPSLAPTAAKPTNPIVDQALSGIPATPTPAAIAPDPDAQAVEAAKQQYPRFAKYPIALMRGGAGPDYSETYPPDEEGNPKPGNWTIQLRSKDALENKNTTSQIGLEMIHALFADDPKYQKFTDQFIQSMTPNQMAATKRAYQRDLKENPDDKPAWNDWLRRVQAQEYIRGGIFTDVIPGWVGPKGEAGYTPQQMQLLSQIKQYLQTSDGQ